LSIINNWNTISTEEASLLLFQRCVELMLNNSSYLITTDANIRILTQRLYGDYRQVARTQEFKRAEKHVFFFKNTGLGRELF
jgi:hypothetical protein